MLIDIQEFLLSRSKRATPKKIRAVASTGVPVLKGGKGSPWKHTRTGYRDDLQIVLRSGWEANFCRVMTAFEIKFDFEPYLFTYPIQRGTRGYTPDFFLRDTKEWIEVKGYFDDKSRIKIKRFKKYYPEEFARLTMIIGNSKASIAICEALGVPYALYTDLTRAYKDQIRNWE